MYRRFSYQWPDLKAQFTQIMRKNVQTFDKVAFEMRNETIKLRFEFSSYCVRTGELMYLYQTFVWTLSGTLPGCSCALT